MVRDELQLETYKVDINKKYNKKIIIFLILLSIILIALVTVNIVKVIKSYNVYKGYEAQIISLKNQEEKRQEEKERERQAKLPKLTDKGKQNIENIYYSEIKQAFLTFDDGPSTVTAKILDVLKQENIKATFFVLG